MQLAHHLLGRQKTQTQSESAACFDRGEHAHEPIQKSHVVELAVQLLLAAILLDPRVAPVVERCRVLSEVVEALVDLLVRRHLLLLLGLIEAGLLPEQLRDSVVLGDPDDERVVVEFADSDPLGLVADEALPDEVLKIF